MKTPTEDHDLIRWLDGEMNAAESERFAARLQADPVLKADADALKEMSAALRAHLPAELPVPHADFFNSQILERIEREEAQTSRAPAARPGWLEWFRLPSLAAAAAIVAVLAAGVMIWQQEETGESIVLSSYAPNPTVQARTFHSPEAQATVLMLDGLEAMPPDRKIVGFHIERSEREQDVATTLYGTRGEVVLVVSEDSRHQPRLLSASTQP